VKDETRRSFAGKVGVAAAGFLNFNSRAKGANEKVVLALIGGRNQGRGVALRAIRQGAEIKTFCDIDDEIVGKVSPDLEKAQGRKPTKVRDFRRVLDDRDIDGVIIATPDHWHAHMVLPACQAGKDIYIEKPLSQTIREGQLMRDAARKYKRVAQVGLQGRSAEHYKSAAEYVAGGKLGKICLVKAWHCQVRNTIGNPPDGTPPTSADYDAWLGPAPKRPFNQNRFHYNWRFFWDYGNSELGNQGVHAIDGAMQVIQAWRGIENCLPKRISSSGGIYWLDDAKEVPDTQVVTYDYGDFLFVWELRSFARHRGLEGAGHGIAFYGTEAALVVSGGSWNTYPKDGGTGPSFKGEARSHEGNFLECIKTRKRPNGDIELGRLSTTICHLGNISHHLGREVRFDPKSETFGDDKAANARLTKQYRSAYPLPKV
jgi:predicted dehydrogenase